MPEPLTLESLAARVEALEHERSLNQPLSNGGWPTAQQTAERLAALEALCQIDWDFDAICDQDSTRPPEKQEQQRDSR